MASSQDTEITLGTAKLLGLFFALVGICAVFFALGYTLGRKSDSALAGATTLAPVPANGAKPVSSGAAPSAQMTFYKAVEQPNGNPQLLLRVRLLPQAHHRRARRLPDCLTPWPRLQVRVISCR